MRQKLIYFGCSMYFVIFIDFYFLNTAVLYTDDISAIRKQNVLSSNHTLVNYYNGEQPTDSKLNPISTKKNRSNNRQMKEFCFHKNLNWFRTVTSPRSKMNLQYSSRHQKELVYKLKIQIRWDITKFNVGQLNL